MSKLLKKKVHRRHSTKPRPRRKIVTSEMKDKYHDYLYTEKWHRIRKMVAERDGYICTKCGKVCEDHEKLTGFQVHHRNYKHIYDEENNLHSLRFLCKECHENLTKRIHSVVENRERKKRKKAERRKNARQKKLASGNKLWGSSKGRTAVSKTVNQSSSL